MSIKKKVDFYGGFLYGFTAFSVMFWWVVWSGYKDWMYFDEYL